MAAVTWLRRLLLTVFVLVGVMTSGNCLIFCLIVIQMVPISQKKEIIITYVQ